MVLKVSLRKETPEQIKKDIAEDFRILSKNLKEKYPELEIEVIKNYKISC